MHIKEYIVYDGKTDFPICLGTARECSNFLGISESAFRSFLSLFNNGKRDSLRYHIYDLDKLLEGYDDE